MSILLSVQKINGQKDFIFLDSTSNYVNIPFKLINNLIILEVKINDIPLNLILDTGVKQTILINLKKNNSNKFKQVTKKYFIGTGNDKNKIEAIKSINNRINIFDKILGKKQDIYIVSNVDFRFSEILGISIFGFIGGEFLDDFIVEINYKKKILSLYKRNTFSSKILKKYIPLSISLRKDKPYIKSTVFFNNKKHSPPLNLLIDTGNSSALWIFEPSKINMPENQKKIPNYFGLGFNGEIKGKTIKIKKLVINNKLKFKNVYTGLPDSIFYNRLIRKNKFDGIIGGEILKRFTIILDYSGKKLYLKKRCRLTLDPFYFNNSGINLVYAEKIPIRFKKKKTDFEEYLNNEKSKNKIIIETEFIYEYRFVPKIVISYIRPDSPADKSGLKKGDVILKINGKNIYNYSLHKIEKTFLYKSGNKLTFLIKRDGLLLELILYNDKQF